MNQAVKCPKHTTGGGPCYCQPSRIDFLSDLLEDEGAASFEQAAAAIQAECEHLVEQGYWVCITIAKEWRKDRNGKVNCLAYVLNPPDRQGGQTEYSKAWAPDLADALGRALRGEHQARKK